MEHRYTALLALWAMIAGAAQAQEIQWPKEFLDDKGSVIIYQPQIERFDGNELEARAAVAVKLKSRDDVPVFGAVWILARVDTDRSKRTVIVRDIDVSDVRFADGGEQASTELAQFLEREIEASQITMSLDALLTDLDVNLNDIAGLKHDAPAIALATAPTILIIIDGEPSMQGMDGSNLQRVVNTPYLIVKDEKQFYLSGGGDLWYTSRSALGPWTVAASVPNQVMQLADSDAENSDDTEGDPPAIMVATVPTELIVSAGTPSWSPIETMGLLYMDNTDSNVFLELTTQKYYVLLSGRWYRGVALNEAWEHVPNDQLPEAFLEIDEASVNGDVLSQIAGTQQARDAVLDNSIPQTAAINRDDSSLDVSYDGDPKFDDIENVRVEYAVNTQSSVFKVNNVYFAVDDGVWFQSSSATGPWSVATSVPDAIYDIPPSNPHYNVTYVRVYDVTPEVVYVGYTPGYMNGYYYHGTVVYGTGWYYRPWYGSYYYPRPSTWGFHVHYNPWTGWNFGISWHRGPFTFGFGTAGYGGWFGAGGYRPYYRPYVGVGYRKTNININQNINVGNINIGGKRPGSTGNIYDRPKNKTRNLVRPESSTSKVARAVPGGNNNVYADRQGDVYRRDNNGKWQQRDKQSWTPATNLDSGSTSNRVTAAGTSNRTRSTTTTTRQPSSSTRRQPSSTSRQRSTGNATRPSLERSHNARQRGATRTQQYRSQRGARRR